MRFQERVKHYRARRWPLQCKSTPRRFTEAFIRIRIVGWNIALSTLGRCSANTQAALTYGTK